MAAIISTPMCCASFNSNPTINFPRKSQNSVLPFHKINSCSFSPLSKFPLHKLSNTHSYVKASSSSSSSPAVGSSEYSEETATKVKFQKSICLPGCSSPLSLIGTGYREKVFAIIGVKVYAAGLYVNQSIISSLNSWKGQSGAQIKENQVFFSTIFQAQFEKTLQIVLVRDVDGNTFWDALDQAISPRIKAPTPVDATALSTFRAIFQSRPLKKGTSIFLVWLDPSKMQICISSDGMPSSVDATIESMNVNFALFDVFFGDAPVSPSLKESVANEVATILN
ncbi:fatty-acid-binding protein 3, chloroplastic [Mercurialis annua]|uniref:fatty-acid-binding protein 3, chloroplastic n=1 Tax=Mercurialis annua TaxID=3986 RepID=UPI00215EB5CE|nr:fatty-acid-binding protein 3, chloroplastic [Mercurialis annua]XP_050220145.1 fatty-acid-binding protein 3, chloroplastic [Mercurialis annua]XP_050220146.1 fatty-acid-binding protein 3, chloroplastic [Mercurialis annua]XP_055960828.1 fatty-acid-binding protein 3, chloroplastic [Mercurialis annua]XP_055960829.1 fatty-acid-binding protein 3, chloroplastic [Mercurialis annua]